MSNPGTATLKIAGITLTGADPGAFALKKSCGTKLSKSASCTLSVTFTPASSSSFTATVSVADNATGSPHTIAVSGTGKGAPSSTQTLVIEPDQGLTPIYNLLNSAKSTIDMTMYELVDTETQQILTQQAAKGVVVRVILDQALEKASNTPVYTYSQRQRSQGGLGEPGLPGQPPEDHYDRRQNHRHHVVESHEPVLSHLARSCRH